jgi:hypothetical protein
MLVLALEFSRDVAARGAPPPILLAGRARAGRAAGSCKAAHTGIAGGVTTIGRSLKTEERESGRIRRTENG